MLMDLFYNCTMLSPLHIEYNNTNIDEIIVVDTSSYKNITFLNYIYFIVIAYAY